MFLYIFTASQMPVAYVSREYCVKAIATFFLLDFETLLINRCSYNPNSILQSYLAIHSDVSYSSSRLSPSLMFPSVPSQLNLLQECG